MNPLKCAVIGAGYLGTYHARKYAALPDAELVAVADIDAARAEAVAAEHGCRAVADYRALFGAADAVSVAVPTRLHHEIAKACLEHGLHVLVEKPIAARVDEADDLIQTARRHDRVLQVGHLERFNAAVLNLEPHLGQPLFIESHRLAPFKPRATDVDVVLDLMIHDIDLILEIVHSDIRSVAASGARVLSDAIDIANARLEFTNGCVANVTASRVSMKAERKLRVFQRTAYVSLDLHNKGLTVHRRGEGEMFPGIPEIISEETAFEDDDPLGAQVAAFIDSIRSGRAPRVSGEDAKRALETAVHIKELVHAAPAYRESAF